jgi:hypothetical protein
VLVRLALWSLADSKTTIAELRRSLRDGAADEHGAVRGLRLKTWVSDETTERWGELTLWESREAADADEPPSLGELIGKPPDILEEFDLEASIEGRFADEELSRRGLAFE